MRKRLSLLQDSAKIAAAFVLLAEPVAAATYYVSPSGSASAAGTARSAPTTPASALGKVNGGDIVVFLDGVYTQAAFLSRSGTAGSPITLRADDGAVPIFRGNGSGNGSGIGAIANISHYVIDGLWFENWGSGGLEVGWTVNVDNLVIRNCVADMNLRAGFSPFRTSNLTFERNIASRNGWGPSSWSSNVNIWGVRGTNNVVRGNVSFHGVDTSSAQSDGNGFILDVTLAGGTALFENNVAFLNGGSCISVTDSGSAQLIGNTCYANSQRAASYMDELNMGNTCRGLTDGIPINQTPFTFTNLVVRNNALIPTLAGKDGINVYNNSPCGGGTSYTQSGNHVQNGGGALFENAAAADFRPKAGSALIDKVAHGTTFGSDIGFDPKCIKLETDATKQKYAYWTFAPDLAYMKSIGGIRACFAPRTRPQGANQEIGAYELVTTTGCNVAACNDNNACTTDACGANDQCTNTPIAGCCTSAAQCNDNDACTTDACTNNQCVRTAVANCCTSAAQCNDNNACTTDACANNQCVRTAVANCCTSPAQCNDNDACTADACTNNQCVRTAVAGCCRNDAGCNDNNACTSDTCNLTTHQCSTSPISGCCLDDGDCSSNNACVASTCNTTTRTCMTAPIPGCCSDDDDCRDDDECTSESCNTSTRTCSIARIAECCLSDGDCADDDACTTDSCDRDTNRCENEAVEGCCVDAGACDDDDECTDDACSLETNRCTHVDNACGMSGAGGMSGGGGSAMGGGGNVAGSTGTAGSSSGGVSGSGAEGGMGAVSGAGGSGAVSGGGFGFGGTPNGSAGNANATGGAPGTAGMPNAAGTRPINPNDYSDLPPVVPPEPMCDCRLERTGAQSHGTAWAFVAAGLAIAGVRRRRRAAR